MPGQWPNRNEPEVAENPDTICELCPLTSLVTRFRSYGTGTTQRPLFFAGVTVYVMNSDFFVPAFCFKAPSFVHLSGTFSNFRRSLLGLCFTCCTNPVQPHKCLKWVAADGDISRLPYRTDGCARVCSARSRNRWAFSECCLAWGRLSRNPQV